MCRLHELSSKNRTISRSNHTISFHFLDPLLPYVVTAPSGPRAGQGRLAGEVSRSHSETSHSVGLLWTSDHPDAETSTCQHTTLARTVFHAVGGIQTRNPSKLAAADPHFTPRCHWDIYIYIKKKLTVVTFVVIQILNVIIMVSYLCC